MADNTYTLASGAFEQANAGRYTATAIARRIFQGTGGGICLAFAGAMPWAEFTSEGVGFGSAQLPAALLITMAVTIAVGLVFFAISVWGLVRRLPAHTRFGVAAISLAGLGSVAGLEYGYFRTDGLSFYEYRGAARMLCYCLGITLLACSVPEELGPRCAAKICSMHVGRRHILALALLATAAGAAVGAVVLDGMPHMIDATTYLLQGRMLWSGHLVIDAPEHLALFEQELLAFRLSEAGYYGKYPVGWPLILGLFDAIGVAWLAAPVLAGALVVLTYLTVSEYGSPRIAGMSAACVALCPWLWMNAGTMMSHLASAVWLWLFLWLMIRTVRRQSRVYATLAGLALGAAVLTRPADAAFFALPCVVASIGWMIRRPDVWLTRLPLIPLAALPGVGIYLWINATVTAGGGSTYGDSHANMLIYKLPQSMGHTLVWLHQSWAGLSGQWFSFAAPAGLAIVCGIVFGARFLRNQILVMACSISLFLCYAIFVFGGRAWVGPRWYVPLIPACAFLMAAGFIAAARSGRMRTPGGVLAAGYLRATVVAFAVLLLVVLPIRVFELIQSPPHGISGQLVETVQAQGLTNAVVALPENGLDPDTGMPNYKRGIAGMWAMQIPFEESSVIYISAVDNWQAMAQDAWPGRTLYTMSGKAGDWELNKVTP